MIICAYLRQNTLLCSVSLMDEVFVNLIPLTVAGKIKLMVCSAGMPSIMHRGYVRCRTA